MSCCNKRYLELARKLIKAGHIEEAMDLIEVTNPVDETDAAKYEPPAGPKELGPLYSKCRDWAKTSPKHKNKSEKDQKTLCSKISWIIYKKHINPDYKPKTE